MTIKTPPDGRDEFSLRGAMSQTCRQLQHEGLDGAGLLSMSHRWARSGANGLLAMPASGPDPLDPENWQWHPAEPIESAQESWLDDPPAPGLWHELHLAVLAERPQTHCVLMIAPPYASALACLPGIQAEGIPPFHPALAALGGDHLPCATMLGKRQHDGPRAMIDSVLEALSSRSACLLANHGALITGSSISQTLIRARRLEALARIYAISMQLGEPVRLDAGQMHNSFDAWQIPD